MTLADHIAALNAKTQAWIDEVPGRRIAYLYTTDMSHWNSCEIHTVEDFERYELETAIWDTYKEVHGVRPRGINFKEMSITELKEMLAAL